MSAEWFKCFPTSLLGELVGMPSPDCALVFVVVFMRVFESDAPIADAESVLARRCGGLTQGRVRAALSRLISEGKVTRLSDGRLDIEATRAIRADRAKRREEIHLSAKRAANTRWQKDEQNQENGDAECNASRMQSQKIEVEVRDSLSSSESKDSSSLRHLEPNDPKAEQKKKRSSQKAESDEDAFWRTADLWNGWAAKHGSPQVKLFTTQRAKACRRRLSELMEIEGVDSAEQAFGRLLQRCSESFFAKAESRSPLTLDQLLRESFMTRMWEGGFRHEPTNGAHR